MRKTKIVCTMGPSTDKPGILRQLMENGMNVARFNFSHGDYEEHKGRYDKVRALSKELDLPIACMLDQRIVIYRNTFCVACSSRRIKIQRLEEKETCSRKHY